MDQQIVLDPQRLREPHLLSDAPPTWFDSNPRA